MSIYELSLTPDYVPDWGIVEAVRELFQNALDQQTVNPENKMFWDYSEEYERLTLGNKTSMLETKSLLLGSTTKVSVEKTIGQFGEGYKVACLVFARLGKKVTIYNYGAKEVWKPRIRKSRKYGSDILIFDVQKVAVWSKVPDHDLTFEIEGINESEFEDIVNSNLHVQEEMAIAGSVYSTGKGEILLCDDQAGRMYVNGLYICAAPDFQKGYNFKPEQVRLDRDRSLISSFDLSWATSEMWLAAKDPDMLDTAIALVNSNCPDTKYITNVDALWDSRIAPIATKAYEDFRGNYGPKAIPVTTQEQAEKVPKSHKPVIVSETAEKVIKASSDYEEPEEAIQPTLEDEIEDWILEYGGEVSEGGVELLRKIAREHS
jgi:hypothetical protein